MYDFLFFSFEVFVAFNPIQLNIKRRHIYTHEGGGMNNPEIGSYSTEISIGVLSYKKLVKDLIEKMYILG